MSKQIISISIDTEFESSNMITCNCLQLAFVAFLENADPNSLEDNEDWIVDRISLCFKDQGKEKEDGVMAFWAKFPEMHVRILSEGIDMYDAMQQLQQWLNQLYERYEVKHFVSDVVAVDFAWFRNLYLTHTNKTLNTFNVPYNGICLTGMIKSLTVIGDTKETINAFCTSLKYPHTHYALDDAIECAYFYLKLKKYIIERKMKSF